MALADLETKYLETSVAPVYTANTEITVHVEGAKYFPAILAAIKSTAAGDSVFIVGWQFDPLLNLATGAEEAGISSPSAIGNVLVQKAGDLVDVRIVLNGTPNIYWVEALPFSRNLRTAEMLRGLHRSGSTDTPLAERVLYDWSGANWTGSHHQKATVIRRGDDLIAFVGGMDMVTSHWDDSSHNHTKPVRPPWNVLYGHLSALKWGWHDAGVELRGEAANGVWENFRHRWEEARTLPERTWKRNPGDEKETPQPFNPTPGPVTPAASSAPPPTFPVPPKQSVQILRSRYRYKIPNRCAPGGINWKGIAGERPTTGPFLEVFRILKKAIAAAQTYIYIEDQFLEDSIVLEQGPPMVHPKNFTLFPSIRDAAERGVKIAFLGSGRGDPDDPVPPVKNTALTTSLSGVISGLSLNLKSNVAVWRLEGKTVHSKLMIIDDEFAAIGSANFQSRSMAGVDSELHAAIVAEDDLVEKLRTDLWAHHWALDMTLSDVATSARDLTTALGLWYGDWYPANTTFWPDLTKSSNANGQLARLAP